MTLPRDSLAVAPSHDLKDVEPGTGCRARHATSAAFTFTTQALAERGCRLIGVELSPVLAAVAERRLAAYPNAEIVVAAFEDWPLPAEPFDTVVSATAFHWLDPAVRVAKAADALRSGGALATIGTHHVAGGTAGFFVEVQDCYERWDPPPPTGLRLPDADALPRDSVEVDSSGRFGPTTFRRYEWEIGYSTAAYRDLLLSYSRHIDMESIAQAGLLDCIGDLMETRYGGRIAKRYMAELRVARTIDQ